MSQELNTVGTVPQGAAVVVPSGGPVVHETKSLEGVSEQAVAEVQASLGRTREAVEAAVEEANQALVSTALSVRFSVEGDTDQIVVRLMDQDTGEVVRQIPSEDQLAISARLRELVGVFFDSRS